MQYKIFSVKNLGPENCSTTIAPWELVYNPRSLQEANLGGYELMRRNDNPSLRYYTPFEGKLSHRIIDSRENPIQFLHGILVEYDNDFSYREVNAQAEKWTGAMPAYIQKRYKYGYRALWLFEKPVYVPEGRATLQRVANFLDTLARLIKAPQFLPGFDQHLLKNPYTLYSSRGEWTEMSGDPMPLLDIEAPEYASALAELRPLAEREL